MQNCEAQATTNPRGIIHAEWYTSPSSADQILATHLVTGNLVAKRYSVGRGGQTISAPELFAILDQEAATATFILGDQDAESDLVIKLQRPATPVELSAAQLQHENRTKELAAHRQANLEQLYATDPDLFLAVAAAPPPSLELEDE